MKKGQAAMEFLMVYGWAIVVTMIAIGALFYFDVLNVEDKMPQQANFPPPFETLDQSASQGNGDIVILLKNNLNTRIEILPTGYTGTKDCAVLTDFTASPTTVDPFENFKVTFTCPNAINNRVSTYLTFTYNNTQSGTTHTTTGFVSVNG